MPSLPKPRFGRSARARGDVVSRPAEPETPHVETVETDGLRWIHIERPRAIDRAWLEEHFDFHPLDYEDVFSRNQRAKIDEYDDYLFIVLHFPRFDKQVGRLNAAELDIYFDDINDASERIWQMLEGFKETAEALEDTNESVLTHQLNDVLRVLTVLTVVFLPLTLVAGIWGMNTGVPGEGNIGAFWIIVGVMVVMLLGMLAFARRRGWL